VHENKKLPGHFGYGRRQRFIIADVFLSVELTAFQLLSSDSGPYALFRIGHIFPEVSGKLLEPFVEGEPHVKSPYIPL
jgi:hypothetical protein